MSDHKRRFLPPRQSVCAIAMFHCGTLSVESAPATLRNPFREVLSAQHDAGFRPPAPNTEIIQILIEFSANLNQVFCVFYESLIQI
ncbi:hypothetical protein FP026_19135 [Rhizobium tropici]|uniref:Uncharacterized protein n=2 Tax=Rhizobium tropici TaxID=398 RepID=A0A5B0VVF2_RHITR|nr:hypothetical protein FP026_19135 [Rhizobium tropici]